MLPLQTPLTMINYILVHFITSCQILGKNKVLDVNIHKFPSNYYHYGITDFV